jgi:predicted membrane chloride channel (bestrophin family)
MFTFRSAALAQRLAERRERRAQLLLSQEAISRALQSQARGDGDGPSDADFSRLAVAMAISERADAAYLQLLSQVADEIIACAQASARSRG